MKKGLPFLLATLLFFVACKKDHSATSLAGKKYKVLFNVTNFGQKQSTFALKQHRLAAWDTLTNLNSYFDILHYIVYGGSNIALIRDLVQDSTMSTMGTITDSLAPGTYSISIIAGKQGLHFHYVYPPRNTYFDYESYDWKDTFWTHFDLTIDSVGLVKNVTLNRVVGKLGVQLLDNMPASVDSLLVTLSPEISSLYLWSGQYQGSPTSNFTYGVFIPASAKGKPNFTLDKIVGNANAVSPMSVTITCKDANHNTIATTTVTDVTCHVNEKTILSGHLFGGTGPSGQSFVVKVDTAWGGTSTVSF